MIDMDGLVEQIAATFVKQVETLDEVFQKPFLSRKRSRAEQVTTYLSMRDDVEAWRGLIQKHGPDEARQYAAAMEKLLQGED